MMRTSEYDLTRAYIPIASLIIIYAYHRDDIIKYVLMRDDDGARYTFQVFIYLSGDVLH